MDIRTAIATYATMPIISGGIVSLYKWYNGEDLSVALTDGAIQAGAVILNDTVASTLTIGNYSNDVNNLGQIEKFRNALRILLSGGIFSIVKAKTTSGREIPSNILFGKMQNNFLLSASSSLVGGYSEKLIKRTI